MRPEDQAEERKSVRPKDDRSDDEEKTVGIQDVEEAKEEGSKAEVVRIPEEPTKQEWEEHMTTHVPYRSWCPYCVRGRGRSDQHRKGTKEPEKRLLTISMDYAYLNTEEGKTKGPYWS